jgi:MFS family permease
MKRDRIVPAQGSSAFRAVTGKFYAFRFFDDFILIYPLSTILFAHAGLGPYSITSLLAAWSLMAFVLEMPSGTLADRFPRKCVLLVGILLRAVGYTVWLVDSHYGGFLIGFLLWGVKSAFTSGTLEALVYDELGRLDALAQYTRVTGRMQSLRLVATVLASLAASMLARHGYAVILAAVLASGVAIALVPKAPATGTVQPAPYLTLLRDGIRAVTASSRAVYIVLAMSVVAGFGAVDEYFSLFLHEKGFSNAGVAVWTAIIFALGAGGSYLAPRLDGRRVPVVVRCSVGPSCCF